MEPKMGPETAGITDTPLGRKLTGSPFSFEFFQAVALLQRLRPGGRTVGGFSLPAEEAVHFRVNQRLGFPASQIQSIKLSGEAPPEMTVNFMGLTGSSGILPEVYSELILERARAGDTSLADFLDIFNNRLIALFYRAWQKSRFPATYAPATDPATDSDGDQDRFTGYLMDLVGLGTAGLARRQEIDDEALLHYASLVGMQSRSAAALEQIIGDYFDVRVEVEQFVGSWFPLDETIQCSLTDEESPSMKLGGGAVVGDAIWDRQGRAKIRIGPLSLKRYREFLPDGAAHKSLKSLVRFFSNGCLDFELQLVLKAGEVPRIELDFDAEVPARLGWLSWAVVAPAAKAAAIEIHQAAASGDPDEKTNPVLPDFVPMHRDETILSL